MSTHKSEVVNVHLEPHENADTLSVVRLFDGYTVVVKTEDWEEGQLGIYITPDTMVPVKVPQFSFLADQSKDGEFYRLRAKRLRGVYSMGLLIKAPQGAYVGENYYEALGFKHYEPPVQNEGTGGKNVPPPAGYAPDYDVENFRRYGYVFLHDEEVYVTEKIHGANARYLYDQDKDIMYAGSHHHWKEESPQSLWWKALKQHPEVQTFCRGNPHLVVYAEVYGCVQDLRYGREKGEISIAVYDIRDRVSGRWLNAREAREVGVSLPWVPTIYVGQFNTKEMILDFAEGPSSVPLADHDREGIVVKSLRERYHDDIGRVNLKVISNHYLEKAERSRIKAEAKKADRKDRQPQPHRHKWSVVGFNDQKSNHLSVKCECGQYGVVEPKEGEITEAWDRAEELPYPFRSDYRRIKLWPESTAVVEE